MSSFVSYITLLKNDWLGRIATLFTVLTIITWLLPGSIPPAISSIISRETFFVLAFITVVLAGYRVNRLSAKQSEVIFHNVKPKYISLKNGGITFKYPEVIFESELSINFSARAQLTNSKIQVAIELFIHRMEPNCLSEGVSPADIKLSLKRIPADPHRTSERLDNPYLLGINDSINVLIEATIPFDVAKIEKTCGSLSAFQTLVVTLAAQPVGQPVITESIVCDLRGVHESILGEVAGKMSHLGDPTHRPGFSADHILQKLQRYWTGKESH